MALAAVPRRGGSYALVSSAVFGVDYENGSAPGEVAGPGGGLESGPWHLPLVFVNSPSGGWPQSFVRIANLRDAGARLLIRAFDEQGVIGTDEVDLGPNEALQFNSADLEEGNPDKQLAGFGRPRQGHWRLQIEPVGTDSSNQSFFAGAYARTIGCGTECFLTAMHDYAQRIANAGDAAYPYLYAVPIFNPARNVNQISRLRVTNLGDASRSYLLAAVDDGGDLRKVTIGPVAAGATQQFSADVLENSYGLNRGQGKWFFVVGGGPALVAHVMQSAIGATAGQWSNLTSVVPVGAYYSQEDIVRIFRQAQDSQPAN